MLKQATEKSEQYAEVFKALSNPQRLKIFMSLAYCGVEGIAYDDSGNCCECVSALGEGTGLTLSTVSHHLKELRHAGLIKTRRRGQHIECWVEKGCLSDIADFLKSI